ncbi:MAG: holo-ACP synthase [Gammaproteobacteria bacterium]|nr:holo-ACP synthase [Gammaproteobacteria bacterium]
MIHGIGTDIVYVPRMAKNIQRFGKRFAQRLLDPQEYAEFDRQLRPAHFLAKRFAAKEAAAKALGTGFRDGIHFQDISVVHDAYGKPGLQFSGAAAQLLRSRSVSTWHLSLADEAEYAVAFVVLAQG